MGCRDEDRNTDPEYGHRGFVLAASGPPGARGGHDSGPRAGVLRRPPKNAPLRRPRSLHSHLRGESPGALVVRKLEEAPPWPSSSTDPR
jgi:hypothetical protein